MKHTKANFKALRESLGMSQHLLAYLMGVDKRSVQRWESPSATAYRAAPEEAWELLEGFLKRQEWVVETSLEKADEVEEELGEARSFQITYWLSEDEYEQAHPGEGTFWQMANANSRLVAATLRAEGREVEFGFPGLMAINPSEEQGSEE